jgi:peroxiredoxin
VALASGDRVPEFTVLRDDEDPVSSSELWAHGPKVVLFFPFAFSGVTDG